MHIKNLIIWRHADAEVAAVNQIDTDRALTEKGIKQAQEMSTWLKKYINKHTIVLTSPALRAKQTTEFLKHKVVVVSQLNPETNVEYVIDALTGYQTQETVILVGHQPWLGQLVAHLLGIDAYAFSIKKGAIWWLRLGSREVSQYQLYAIQTPQLLA